MTVASEAADDILSPAASEATVMKTQQHITQWHQQLYIVFQIMTQIIIE